MHGEEDEAAREERARSHITRAAILSLFADEEIELTVARIGAELDWEPSLRDLYYHLRVLVACKLLVEEDGRFKPA